MKTKIVHYGAEEDIFRYGEYDQHDADDIGQGVYGKKDMMRFVSIVTIAIKKINSKCRMP